MKTKTPKQAQTALERRNRLLPDGIPRWVRCYDNGGESCDRYTAVFSGKASPERSPGRSTEYPYLAMSERPFHPQGFGQHGSSKDSPCDAPQGKWPPAIGRKCHLGTRIKFTDLPEDCQRAVMQDYIAIWKI